MPTNEEVGKKKEAREKEQHKPKHKKRKARKNANIVSLDGEDITMIADAAAGVAHTSLKSISRKYTPLTNKITTHVNRLTEAINEVRRVVEAETHGADLADTLETPLLLPPLKVEVTT